MLEIFKILGTVAIDNSKAKTELDETVKKGDSTQSRLSSAFKKIGTAVVAGFAVDKIKDFGLTCVETAAAVKASNSQFEQTFGNLAKEADAAMKRVADSSGILETRLQDSGTKIYAFAKTTGMDSSEALGMMEDALQVAADSAAYYDRSLEDTTETLQSFLKGNYENDAALGLSATETTRNTAANKLYGKSFKDLSESQKQLTLLQMVKDANKLSGAMGQAARESDGFENVTGNLKESWRQFLAVIGSPILSGVIPIIKGLTDGVSWLSGKVSELSVWYDNMLIVGQGFSTWCANHQIELSLIAIAIGTVTAALIAYNSASIIKKAADIAETVAIYALIAAENIHTAASTASTVATTAFGTAVAFLTSPITLAVAAIGALIAIGVLLYQNWDTVCQWANKLKDKVITAFNNIKRDVVNALNGVIEFGRNAWSFISNLLWSPIKWFLDKIGGVVDTIVSPFKKAADAIGNAWSGIRSLFKLPHFTMKGSLNPLDWLDGGLPSFGVEWYAKGGLMTGPTAFGINPKTGNMMVGGEAGDEAIAPLSKLEEYYKKWSNEGNSEMLAVLKDIRDYLADNERWYRIMLRALKDGSFAVMLDGREIGRIVRKYA